MKLGRGGIVIHSSSYVQHLLWYKGLMGQGTPLPSVDDMAQAESP